jgi:predicted metalloprotease with PDZ domain
MKMHRSLLRIFLILPVMLACFTACQRESRGELSFVVSMDQPSTHYYHVEFTCEGLNGTTQCLTLPAWTPGYYVIVDFAKYIHNFKAEDDKGNALPWKKLDKDTWEVATGRIQSFKVTYDVFAFITSVAHPFLDDGRGFISPAGVFMYPEGMLGHPVTVTIKPYEKWTAVSTGLDPVEGKENTFTAPDYDRLYDCPILCGNQEILHFDVQGIPYTMAVENLGSFNRDTFITDHKRMVESATRIIGEVPYKHYTFLMMNEGMGGLEHLNSMAVFGGLYPFETPEGYRRWLDFISHEFFHLYNVKTIHPIALGPFDYEKENYTDMLWLSEGGTVYYEDIVLVRAGLISREEYFRNVEKSLANYENIPGHRFQSLAESSFDTWILFFNRSADASNTTISYYDKGCIVTLMLDYAIRHESGNKKSLDDAMRYLYQVYYKEKHRGFTDQEFREVCEKMAGIGLPEIFDVYIPTTREPDYKKYFSYAGLDIDTAVTVLPGAYLGAMVQEREGNLAIRNVVWDSPAWKAGLSAQDEISRLDGKPASLDLFNEFLATAKPGDSLVVEYMHRQLERKTTAVLGINLTRNFTIRPMEKPDSLQAAVLEDCLGVK